MNHVFVETNWIVEHAAPSFFKLPSNSADDLLQRARAGEFRLELPSICIAESRRAILTRFDPTQAGADKIGNFLRWAVSEGLLDEEVRQAGLLAVQRMSLEIKRELSQLEVRLRSLLSTEGLHVFDVGEKAAHRCTELSFGALDLKPFDQMILASILVRAEELSRGSAGELSFCEIDKDLQPWGKGGGSKEPLRSLYDVVGVWVYGDFQMASPPRPSKWP
jgi:hypothetical protein